MSPETLVEHPAAASQRERVTASKDKANVREGFDSTTITALTTHNHNGARLLLSLSFELPSNTSKDEAWDY